VDDERLTVFAHGWLNTIAVVSGCADMLLANHDRLTAEQRDALLERVREHARLLDDSLRDTVGAARPELEEALRALQEKSSDHA
jgi:hypothetical protein